MEKNIYFVRHGYALHNFLFWKLNREAYNIRDTQLLQEGVEQASELNKKWKEINDIELVVCSPSIRTLDTALLVFKGTKHENKIKALDYLLEYPLGVEECNRRKDKDVLKTLYKNVSFNDLVNNKLPWNPNKRESVEELEVRHKLLLNWIKNRPEKNICVVSHSSYISQFLFNEIPNEENELKHCVPYKYKLFN